MMNRVAAATPLRNSSSCWSWVRSNWVAVSPALSTKIVRAAVAWSMLYRFHSPIVLCSARQHYDAGAVTWVDGGMLENFPISAFDRIDGKPAR